MLLLLLFITKSCKHRYILLKTYKVAGGKGISEMKSKQQSPCSNCMHRPVMSWGKACSTCMHWPVTWMHLTGRCMHLLHGLCCFDFISEIPLLQLLCKSYMFASNPLYKTRLLVVGKNTAGRQAKRQAVMRANKAVKPDKQMCPLQLPICLHH
jgi:hypothetical protein